MAENSKIEWTTHTLNPWIGCTAVSPACDHCYAERLGGRFGVKWGPKEPRKRTSASNWNKVRQWDRKAAGAAVRPRVFCASLADVFDNAVDPAWRCDLWDLIWECRNLDWLLLTKRPQNIAKMLPVKALGAFEDWGAGWPHVWLGTTVENQEEAERRIPRLLDVPARIHFLSMEPLLGPVNLAAARNGWSALVKPHLRGNRIEWVIAGGESGPHARPSHPDWFRKLRDQCAEAGVPFLFKQWGEWVSVSEVAGEGPHFHFDDGATVRRIGKKAAGRTLDGVLHDGAPA